VEPNACQRWTLRVVCTSTALLLLAVAAPNVALSDIAQDLGASFTDLQWVLSGYALALAVFQLTAGTLADLFGRRRLFLIGLVVFSAASGLCALAPSPTTLIAARVLMGVGAAIVFPSSLALLVQEFEGPARRRAIGLWGAVIGLAFAAGPLLGGVLVDVLVWRWVFAVNVVLGGPVVLLALRHVRESRDPIETGLVLAPLAVVSFAVSAVAGRLSTRVPLTQALVGGLALAGAGMLLLSTLEAGSSWLALLPGLAVIGAGVGLTNPLATFAHLGVLPPTHGGLASALNNTARQVGLAIGIAALGALLQASVRGDLEATAAQAVPAPAAREALLDRVADGDVAGALRSAPPEARGELGRAYGDAFTAAVAEQLVLGAGLVLLVAVAAAALIRQGDLWRPPAPVPAAAGAPEPAGIARRPEP